MVRLYVLSGGGRSYVRSFQHVWTAKLYAWAFYSHASATFLQRHPNPSDSARER